MTCLTSDKIEANKLLPVAVVLIFIFVIVIVIVIVIIGLGSFRMLSPWISRYAGIGR
jgi:hypothetical protein